jgi:hypothetical protein
VSDLKAPWKPVSSGFKISFDLSSVTQALGIVMGPSQITVSGAAEYPQVNGVYKNLQAWGGGVLPAWALSTPPPGKVILLSFSNPRNGAMWLITSHDLRPGEDPTGQGMVNNGADQAWFMHGELLYGTNMESYDATYHISANNQVCNDPSLSPDDCWQPGGQAEALIARYGPIVRFWMPPRSDPKNWFWISHI